MNTAAKVDELVAGWIADGLTKSAIIENTCEAELGWPYVWGASGQECNPTKRRYFANRSSCPEGDKVSNIKRCQVLNGSKSSCDGCQFFPNGERTLIDDCQGFVKQVHKRVGITLTGGGATTMYSNNANWSSKGRIADMPKNCVCCVFCHNSETGKMDHVGMYLGNGNIIHCQTTVKRASSSEKRWTHYAIAKGMETPIGKPTLRRGDTGAFVTLAQTELQAKGFSVGASGCDGIFGKATEQAVKDLQKSYGLVVDGVIGARTWEVLDSARAVFYTVIIPHLPMVTAEKLKEQYADATIEEEKS